MTPPTKVTTPEVVGSDPIEARLSTADRFASILRSSLKGYVFAIYLAGEATTPSDMSSLK
jgi:hypothetical protein